MGPFGQQLKKIEKRALFALCYPVSILFFKVDFHFKLKEMFEGIFLSFIIGGFLGAIGCFLDFESWNIWLKLAGAFFLLSLFVQIGVAYFRASCPLSEIQRQQLFFLVYTHPKVKNFYEKWDYENLKFYHFWIVLNGTKIFNQVSQYEKMIAENEENQELVHLQKLGKEVLNRCFFKNNSQV